MSVTDSLMLAGFDLHDVLGRTLVSETITNEGSNQVPNESVASAAKRAERVPPKPPQMEVVKD